MPRSRPSITCRTGPPRAGAWCARAAVISDLRREHGPLRLLLAYAGGYKEETEAHGKFAAAHVTGEWFRPELPLLKAVLHMRVLAPRGDTRLPAQVPVTEIRALIRTARERSR